MPARPPGSTLIAAHKTGRRARIVELDPVYCGRMIRRWEAFAKDEAQLIARSLDSPRRTEGAGGPDARLEVV